MFTIRPERTLTVRLETPETAKRLLKQSICLSGWGDLNSGPSVPQIDAPQTADLHKRPETVSGLPFWLITGSRWFALFRDVSRPVRGLPERQGVPPLWLPVWLPQHRRSTHASGLVELVRGPDLRRRVARSEGLEPPTAVSLIWARAMAFRSLKSQASAGRGSHGRNQGRVLGTYFSRPVAPGEVTPTVAWE